MYLSLQDNLQPTAVWMPSPPRWRDSFVFSVFPSSKNNWTQGSLDVVHTASKPSNGVNGTLAVSSARREVALPVVPIPPVSLCQTVCGFFDGPGGGLRTAVEACANPIVLGMWIEHSNAAWFTTI